MTEDYFGRGQPIESRGWTHFPGAEHAAQPKAEFVWPLGDVVTALVEAGLRIVALRESPAGAGWRFGPAAEVARRLPGTYLLVADKPD